MGVFDVEVGDIVLVFCYDPAYDYIKVREAGESALKYGRSGSTNDEGFGKSGVLFFGCSDPSNLPVTARPVIEDFRPMVISRKTRGTCICLPLYTHGGRGLNGIQNPMLEEFINVRDDRYTETQRQDYLRDQDYSGLGQGTSRRIHASGPAPSPDDPRPYTILPVACVRLTHPYTFVWGVRMRKVAELRSDGLAKLQRPAMEEAFDLHRKLPTPTIEPETRNSATRSLTIVRNSMDRTYIKTIFPRNDRTNNLM